MKNWKTTIGGALASAGALCQLSDNPTIKLVGGLLTAAGALLLGISAKDKNVTGGTIQQ